MSRIERYIQIPVEQWKDYVITTSTGGRHMVHAPNKTIARLVTQGELNPGIKIVKIEEVSR